ncbi:hypothetical protein JCGZ_15387 [Jatropha curcas]|uniref:Uncharacterized protein n=1 Tax=Jatropha curcas TaxID=180498 RepID=A0A067KGZ0_JATCU|nr:hypothetical protein JCGZ_15387 [Jatropha curcas]
MTSNANPSPNSIPRHELEAPVPSTPFQLETIFPKFSMNELEVILDDSEVADPHFVETSNVDSTPQRTFMTGSSPSTSSTSRNTLRIDVIPLGYTFPVRQPSPSTGQNSNTPLASSPQAPPPPAPPIIITKIEDPLSELEFSFLNDLPISSACTISQPSSTSIKVAKEQLKHFFALDLLDLSEEQSGHVFFALDVLNRVDGFSQPHEIRS